jgi:hypothetical protein
MTLYQERWAAFLTELSQALVHSVKMTEEEAALLRALPTSAVSFGFGENAYRLGLHIENGATIYALTVLSSDDTRRFSRAVKETLVLSQSYRATNQA